MTTASIRRGLLLARHLAVPTLALVLTVAVLLVELAYALGHETGAAVHARSEQLARLHVALLGLASAGAEHPQATAQPPAAEPALAAPSPAPCTPRPAAAPLQTTVVALRALARDRGIPSRLWRSARQADLILLLA